nr:exodeoxyribonuclease VII large subunit [Candidatus Dactylopiibacterium carminicum]
MSSLPRSVDPLSARVSSVSEFVLQIRRLVEGNIPLGWIGGEISNLTRAASGHLYFTLKDERAQIRCAMWRTRAQLLAFRPQEGQRVEIRAQATVYEARGDLQLSVEQIRPAGPGNLYEAFLRLKARLETEGLFDADRKHSLPALPRGVGIITSPAAAALRDVLASLRRRAPALPVVLYPCPVQGEEAGPRIAQTILESVVLSLWSPASATRPMSRWPISPPICVLPPPRLPQKWFRRAGWRPGSNSPTLHAR